MGLSEQHFVLLHWQKSHFHHTSIDPTGCMGVHFYPEFVNKNIKVVTEEDMSDITVCVIFVILRKENTSRCRYAMCL